MAAMLGRAACLQLGIKFENVSPPLTKWRAVHTSCLHVESGAAAPFVDDVLVAGDDDCEQSWVLPTIERLYEDQYIIGVSKPGTLLVHNNKASSPLEKQRNAFLKNMVEGQLTAGQKVSPVHRLDRPASGVIIFSKSAVATRAAQASLAHPACIKEYVVLARGSTPDSFICDEPVNDEKGFPKSAISQCEKILDLPDSRCSLLKVIIKTGRWHQIRKHLNHRAHHVVGDVKHGKGKTNRYFRENYKMHSGRIFLHAARLTFPHPLHLSREVWTPASNHPNEISEDIDMYSSASDLEDCESTSSVSDDSSVWMSPNTSFSEDPKTKRQLLTIRAGLPEDLQEVLYSLPEGIDSQQLFSLGIIF